MTPPTPAEGAVLAVTQVDRDAAERLLMASWEGEEGSSIDIFAPFFARHREAAVADTNRLWLTDKGRAATAETAHGHHGAAGNGAGSDAADVIPTQEDINAATMWWYTNHDRPPPANLIAAFTRHRMRSLAPTAAGRDAGEGA